MEGMKLPSDISLSTQNSSFSSGPRGSWRTVKTKVVVGNWKIFAAWLFL